MFISHLLAVLLHEIAHSLIAKNCGYEMRKIVLMPYGAMLYGKEHFYGRVSVKIALSGPIASLIFSLVTLAVWWLFPDTYIYLKGFLNANIMLFALNLLPCFPLDGSRVILGLAKDTLRALKVMKVCGVIIGLVMISFGIATFWFVPNISLINVGSFIIIGTVFGSRKEEYYFIAHKTSFAKDYMHGVVYREIYVSENLCLYNLVKYISDRYLTVFNVVDDNGEIKGYLSEEELEKVLYSSETNTKLIDILK